MILFSYHNLQGWRNRFESGGTMEQRKVLSTTLVGQQEKILISRRSRMSKRLIFSTWWQPFNSFCFQTLSLYSLSPIFHFAKKKNGGGGGGRETPRYLRPWAFLYLLLAVAYLWIAWHFPPLISFSTINSTSISINNSNFTSVFFKDACHVYPGAERHF